MEQIENTARNFAHWIVDRCERVLELILQFVDQAVHWPPLPFAIALSLVVGIYLRYLSWKAGWLSGEIDKEVRRLQRRRLRTILDAAKRITVRSIYRGCRAGLYRCVDSVDRYVRRDAWVGIVAFNFPSFSSFLAACAVLFVFFAVPHLHDLLLVKPLVLLKNLADELADGESVRNVFEGLIVVAVALIVFVAESIRDTRNAEQKRVLLRISSLWPLTVAVTLFPVGYFFGKLTGWTIILIILISLWAIYQFGRVIRNLLDVDLQEESKKRLLKERVLTT